jgi:isoquinoline 1-oxidoreductase beta subunit
MFSHIDHCDLPRALQRLLAQTRPAAATTLPRRCFLKLAGAGGLALGAFPYVATAQSKGGLKPTEQPSAFVQIAANGEVTVTINRLEFGQGVQTALPMILAEELDADWSLVRSRHGSNDAAYVDPLFGIHLTGGSHSVQNSFTQYRELGARARAMLLGAALRAGTSTSPPCARRPARCWARMAASWVTANWPRPRWLCRCPRRSR